MTEELIIGFDARTLSRDILETWDKGRRQRYLYRTDVVAPLSADTTVWPSVFERDELAENVGRKIPGPTDEFFRDSTDFWRNVDELILACEIMAEMHPRPFGVFAFSVITDDSRLSRDPQRWDLHKRYMPRLTSASGWKSLGFDVCEMNLSGLMNCGDITPDDRARWKNKLNVYHLFNQVTDAIEFADWCEVHIPEHCPFEPQRISLVKLFNGASLPPFWK